MISPVIRAVLEMLEDDDGCITPDIVLDAAKDPGSPLHDHFEWDDAKAGHSWRLEQARQLIRAVRVEIVNEAIEIPVVTYGYVRNPEMPHREQGYISTVRVRSKEEIAREVVKQELARAVSAMRRCEEIADLLNLRPTVAKAVKSMKTHQARIERALEVGA